MYKETSSQAELLGKKGVRWEGYEERCTPSSLKGGITNALANQRSMLGLNSKPVAVNEGSQVKITYQSVEAMYHHNRLFISRRNGLSVDSRPGRSTTCNFSSYAIARAQPWM